VASRAHPLKRHRNLLPHADAQVHDTLLRTVGNQLSLKWVTEQPAPAAPEGAEEAVMVIPPADEIEKLWHLACMGNMRQIREQAAHLRELDPVYAAFACRLDTMAQGYHTKQLAVFVARYRTEDAVRSA
jgi:hypothetical protein